MFSRLDVVDETGSTNADLLARAAAGDDIAGAVLIAEHQTAGRGRNGRTWSAAPRAQITLSVGVVGSRRYAARVGLATAGHRRGGRRCDLPTTGVEAGLKWPNDVLAIGSKLAGILAEVAAPQPVIVVGYRAQRDAARRTRCSDPEPRRCCPLGADADRNTLARNAAASWQGGSSAGVTPSGADAALIGRLSRAQRDDRLSGARTSPRRPRARRRRGRASTRQGRLRIGTGDADLWRFRPATSSHLRPSI